MFHNLALIPFRSVKKRLDITRSGIGLLETQRPIGPEAIRPGDQLLVSGDLGRHGLAILAALLLGTLLSVLTTLWLLKRLMGREHGQ